MLKVENVTIVLWEFYEIYTGRNFGSKAEILHSMKANVA